MIKVSSDSVASLESLSPLSKLQPLEGVKSDDFTVV